MGTWGIGHWLIVLLIAVLLFGTKKLGNIGGDVAAAIKSFRKGLQDDDHSAQAQLKADPNATSTAAGSDSKRENTP
ncbi:MAG TPA: twin-arginine translocase TatA/TatE family subunit [Rudaea sp.]|nr:twin-arginine translocase TatA/TatE family subunit [Rudaea sp.]